MSRSFPPPECDTSESQREFYRDMDRAIGEYEARKPTRAELADDDLPTPVGPDPWGDVGPVHHPTRSNLPVPAEPPF
jgi:hypothetical protein